MPRPLIVFLDGTGCTAAGGLGKHFSNVFRTSLLLENRAGRSTYLYFPGPASRDIAGKIVHSVVGSEMNDMVLEAYLSICSNMPEQSPERDRIYLFGYSRGAVVAKALASMIDRVGLLRRESLILLKHAWLAYTDDDAASRTHLIGHTRPGIISFIGLFDPVSGPSNENVKIKIDRYLPQAVKHAVEIVALDENRKAFEPLLWAEKRDDPFDQLIAKPFRDLEGGRLQQILMPGGHGDIGHSEGEKLIADISFLSMAERVQAKTKLRLNQAYLQRVYNDVVGILRSIVIERVVGVRTRPRNLTIEEWTELHALVGIMHDKPVNFKNTYTLPNGRSVLSIKRTIHYKPTCQNTDNAKVYRLSLRNVDAGGAISAAVAIENAMKLRLSQVE